MLLLVAIVMAAAGVLAFWLGASDGGTRALVTGSVSTPIASGVTEALGGLTAISAVVIEAHGQEPEESVAC